MMGKEDVVTNEYMSSPARVADLLNGFVYHGEERVRPNEVRDLRNVLSRWELQNSHSRCSDKVAGAGKADNVQTVTADVVLEVGAGMQAMIVVLEDQTDIHYAMPVRIMNLEAMGYHKQWRQAAKKHRKRKDLSGAEYLSGFAKGETMKPFLPIVLYFGKEEWNGPRCLKDMINMEAYPQEIQELITDYPLHLIEVRKYEEYEEFRTDLRYVFGFLRNAENKTELGKYVDENKDAFQNLDSDAFDIISVMGHSRELQGARENYQKEDGRKYNMCQAIKDMIADGVQQGLEQGLEQGLYKQRQMLVNNVENAMKNFHVDLDGACKGLEVSVEEYNEARKVLEERNI